MAFNTKEATLLVTLYVSWLKNMSISIVINDMRMTKGWAEGKKTMHASFKQNAVFLCDIVAIIVEKCGFVGRKDEGKKKNLKSA